MWTANPSHQDDWSNFITLLTSWAHTDKNLRKHLAKGAQNAHYIAHQVQNKLIQLIGEQIQGSIIKKCQEAKWLTISADESADISCTEHISISIHYVEKTTADEFIVHEDFLWFSPSCDTTGHTIADNITQKLGQWGLDMNYLVGQGYDGAGNRSGKMQGVQALIRENFQAETYVHCRNHCLNLAIIHSTMIPAIMLNTVGELVFFINTSPKRLECYLSCMEDKQWLKKFCETRWLQHDACLWRACWINMRKSSLPWTWSNKSVTRRQAPLLHPSAAAQSASLSWSAVSSARSRCSIPPLFCKLLLWIL